MTETPGSPEGHEPTTPLPPTPPAPSDLPGQAAPPGQSGVPPLPPPAPGYSQQAYGHPAPPAYGQHPYGAGPQAPWGVHPVTGVPYSDKSKLIAGLIQILIPLGIGRIYMGQTGLGVAQLLVTVLTCGIGAVWPFIDGIVILAGDPKDAQGRPLRS